MDGHPSKQLAALQTGGLSLELFLRPEAGAQAAEPGGLRLDLARGSASWGGMTETQRQADLGCGCGTLCAPALCSSPQPRPSLPANPRYLQLALLVRHVSPKAAAMVLRLAAVGQAGRWPLRCAWRQARPHRVAPTHGWGRAGWVQQDSGGNGQRHGGRRRSSAPWTTTVRKLGRRS